MCYQIDAWIDRPSPYIRVLDAMSGECILDFDAKEIEALLSSGDIDQRDLLSADARVCEQVVHELALFRCVHNLGIKERKLTKLAKFTA